MRKTGKEIIEENKVPMTLFIGMGGIGSKIIRGVADMCEGTELTNVNFVVFDTNANDLEDVKDSKNDMYFVQTSSVSTVGDYLRVDKDAMDNWFPRNEVMYGKSMTDGAGQVRAISRLALNSTIKLNHMKPLYDAISDLYRKNGEELKYELRIVMAFSANGGTGSGMALPLSMLLRKYIKDEYPTTTVNIRGLCVLPSVQNSKITSETEKRSLRRNAYATIREINAFMMKGSGFLDNNPKLERYSDIHIDVPIAGSDEVLRLDSLPFNFCFLLDGTDADDKTTPSQDQYIEQASLCLYEQNIGAMKENSFSIEDNIVKESIDKNNLGRNRFGGLGASVIRYPYEEISKYIAYKWAMDRMGGKNSADNWCQYDESFFDIRKQEKEDGKDENEMTPRAVAYTEAMNDENGDEFTRRMYNKYIRNIEEKDIVDGYFDSLETRIMEVVDEICGNVRTKADKAAKNEAIKGENVANGKRVANQKLGAIREYAEFAGRRTIDKKIKREAESIFWNRIYGKKEDREWFLENVLTYNNEFMHPNAMRYVLYKIKIRMDEEIEKANDLRDKEKGNIEKFWTAKTDVLSTGKKDDEKESETIKTIADEFDDNNKIKSELAKKMADTLNSRKNSYYSSVEKFVKNKAMSIVYSVGIAYLKELNKAFEEFYDGFDEKIEMMSRTQEDLAESLIYKPGSTIYNLCGQTEYLERIAEQAKRESDDDILSPDLCAKIFDSLKQNVQLMRHNRYAEEDKLKDEIDVFDEIIIEHFIETVVNECDNIDLNVIQAMEKECMLKHKIKMEKLHKSTSLKGDDKRKKVARYIRYIVKKGYDLAAPGIQRMSDSESREIKLCAYNETLDNLKSFDTKEIFANFNQSSTDTVSKYELRFFTGLYNITPDRIRKFACSLTDKVGTREAGIYFQAYQEYSADIGPDSEKCKVISTHIDKRWDPVRDFPELDMDYQKKKLAEIQRAYIYSLIFEIVKYRSVSDIDTTIKHYRYENSDEKLEDMIVSNGTPCDEYYEVLDHFYISSATVKDVSEQINKRITRDKNRRVNFDKTSFAKALKDFKIPHSHTDDTSLFEIPLAYYSSIPSSIRIDSELEELTTAIIEVLKEQIAHYESEKDRQVLLWKLLKEQFDMMIRNYPKTESLNCNMKLYEHPVVEIIFRAIKKELTEEYNEKIIDEMRTAIGREKSK